MAAPSGETQSPEGAFCLKTGRFFGPRCCEGCFIESSLADYGPREIVLAQSSGVPLYAERTFYEAAFIPSSLDGRTGRGDTCFVTCLDKRLSTMPSESAHWAGAMTTRKQEKPGLWDGGIMV